MTDRILELKAEVTRLEADNARLEGELVALTDFADCAGERADKAEAERDALKLENVVLTRLVADFDTEARARAERAESDLSALKQRVAEYETFARAMQQRLSTAEFNSAIERAAELHASITQKDRP